MLPQLHHIRRACPRVVGGLKTLKLVDPRDLNNSLETFLIPNIAELDFKPGKSAWTFQQDRFSGSLISDPETGDAAGDYHTWRLAATIRTVRLEVEYLRSKLMNRRVHVVATYLDGFQQIVPFMHLSAGSSSGKKPTDPNGYNFNGISKTLQIVPAIAAPLVIDTGSGYPIPAPPAPSGFEPIVVTITDSSFSYTIPSAMWLLGWEVRSDSDQTVSLGTTLGGNQIDGPVSIAALAVWVGNGNSLQTFTTKTIHFAGLAGTNTIKLWIIG